MQRSSRSESSDMDLTTASPDDLAAWRRLLERVGVRTVASWLSPEALRAATLADTEFATEMLEALRTTDPIAARFAAAFPEVVALATPMPVQVEHDTASDRPLLDHVATRMLGRKLRGLERRDAAAWSLSPAVFDRLAATCARVLAAGLGPALRVAMIHLDIAKTVDPALRAQWLAQGISIEVHNEAAAAILRKFDRARSWPLPDVLAKLAIAWIESHGLAGQHVRGEGPLVMFAPLVATLRDLAP